MNDRAWGPKGISTREEQIVAATIGESEPLNATIDLEPYNPRWPSLYATPQEQIRDALGAKALMIEHVGSASVAGLSAKPIIDIVLVVPNSADEDGCVPPLERLGYVLRIREPDWFQHRLLKTCGIDGNVHVFSQGCEEIDRMLAFRDRLRMNEDDRRLYEHTKRELAAQRWKYVQNYADAKSGMVREILGRAVAGKG